MPPPASASTTWWPRVLNIVLFELGWFACVLGAAHGWAWVGTLAVALIAALHVRTAQRPLCALRLLAAALLLGLLFDSALLHTGVLVYTSGQMPGALGAELAPHWILASWVLLGTGLNVSMRWLHRRYLLAAVLGAVAVPWSFWAGTRLGAAHFVDIPLALGLLAAGWAELLPLMVWLSQRFDGFPSSQGVAHV